MRKALFVAVVLLVSLVCAPVTRGQWVQCNGPYSGVVSSFGKCGTILFAAAGDDGLFRSSDSGKTWYRVTNGPKQPWEIITLGNIILIRGGDGYFRSTDAGTSWQEGEINWFESFGSFVVNKNAIYALHGYDVYPTPTEIFASTDSGLTWTPPWDSVGPYPKGAIHGLIVFDTMLFVGCDTGLYESTDGGKSWVPTLSSLSDSTVTVLFSLYDTLFEGTGYGELLQSGDSGKTWTNASSNFSNQNFTHSIELNNKLCIGTDSGVYISTDIGRTWARAGLNGIKVYSFATDGKNLIAATRDSGIYRTSDDGATWSHVGFNCANVNHLTSIDTTLFVSTYTATNYHGSIFRSIDKGANWILSVNEALAEYLFNPVPFLKGIGQELFTGGYNAYSVALSLDKGITWANHAPSFYQGWPNVMYEHSGNLYIGTLSDGIYRSTDNGIHWQLIDSTVYRSDDNKNVWAITFSGSNLIAATGRDGIFLTSDNGSTWISSNDGLPDTAVFALAESGTNLFAGTLPGAIYRSVDNGFSWTQTNNGLAGTQSINTFAVSGDNIFAGSRDSGIFLSTDAGESWMDVSSEMPNRSINELLILGSDLYAGTAGDGVFHRSLSDLGIKSSVAASIPIEPPKSNTLEIYDLLGRCMYRGSVDAKPLLHSGAYIERVGGEVRKIFIP
jgi:photosystem II stability/assembly factor-like uncharacterized protein